MVPSVSAVVPSVCGNGDHRRNLGNGCNATYSIFPPQVPPLPSGWLSPSNFLRFPSGPSGLFLLLQIGGASGDRVLPANVTWVQRFPNPLDPTHPLFGLLPGRVAWPGVRVGGLPSRRRSFPAQASRLSIVWARPLTPHSPPKLPPLWSPPWSSPPRRGVSSPWGGSTRCEGGWPSLP